MANKRISSFRDVKYAFKEKYITLESGMKICYVDKGVGFPMVFIHGMGGDLNNFAYNYKYFKENYRVIGLDLPGYGKSGRMRRDYTIDYYANVIEEFLEKIKVSKCILIGNSMGGHIATVYALKDQSRVDRLVLVDSAGLTKLAPGVEQMVKYSLNTSMIKMSPKMIVQQGVRNNFHDTELKECKNMIENVESISENSEEYTEYCHAIKSSMQTMLKERIGAKLYDLKIPVLLIWGKYDCMVPINYAYEFKRKTENSQLVIIDGAGHMPMLEKHKTFNHIVEDFIKEQRKSFFSHIKELLFN